MVIQFFSGIAKKENSTARPSAVANRLSLTGILKEPCSVLAPVVKIERLSNDVNPCIYTYAVIDNFRRYYFVEDWVWADGLWEVHMKEDVLATWRDVIGAQTEYILRTDSTTDYNGDVIDTTYPATTEASFIVQENANPFTPAAIASGVYIVGIVSGHHNNAVGAITYYAMTSDQFGDLKSYLFSNNNLTAMGITDSQGVPLVSDMSTQILKTLYNPYQYIVSCIWLPIDLTDIPNKTAVTTIEIGWWPYTLSGYVLTAPTTIITENDMSLPIHPQYQRGAYLSYAPYTKRTVQGRFGSVVLDTVIFRPADRLGIRYNIDLITGQCRTVFERKNTGLIEYITERDFLLGVPIQLAQVGIDYLGTVATAVSTSAQASGQLMRLDVGGAIATEVSGLYSALKTAMPQLETSGNNGSFLSASNMTKMITIFYRIVDEDIEHRGRPLCELRQINTLSGFILCAEGDIDINCFDNEREAIKKYLTTGFFWEV